MLSLPTEHDCLCETPLSWLESGEIMDEDVCLSHWLDVRQEMTSVTSRLRENIQFFGLAGLLDPKASSGLYLGFGSSGLRNCREYIGFLFGKVHRAVHNQT
jgi:hypothetical protein